MSPLHAKRYTRIGLKVGRNFTGAARPVMNKFFGAARRLARPDSRRGKSHADHPRTRFYDSLPPGGPPLEQTGRDSKLFDH